MIKISVDLSKQQIEKIFKRMPIPDKIRLIRKLEQETLRQRWDGILKDIDRRLRKFPISREEIVQEIKSYRKHRHD